jgi:hypothetical protein
VNHYFSAIKEKNHELTPLIPLAADCEDDVVIFFVALVVAFGVA